MSYQYGDLTQKIINSQEVYYGKIKSPFFSGLIKTQVTKKNGEGAPDGEIFQKDCDFPIGKYWLKETNQDKRRFLSIELDNPMMDKPVYLSAFQDESNRSQFNIVWSRPKKRNNSSNNSSNNTIDQNSNIDDDIPF